MSELTREQVERECQWLIEEHCGSAAKKWLDTDAALRATITQQAQEINKLKQEAVDTTNTHYDTISQIQQAARDAVKEDREQQAQELGRCKSEKNDAVIELYRKLDAKDAELAASQARCRVLEKGFADQTAIRERHEAGFRETIAQLQATLTAREAEVRTLHKQFKVIEQERDAAVQELKRLQLTWTTARPTVAGWYWWRLYPGYTPVVVELAAIGGIVIVPLKTGEWSSLLHPPTEPQQARGSSGGVANHGAGA